MKLRYLLILLTMSVLLPGCCWFHHHRHCCKPYSAELTSLPVQDDAVSLSRPHNQ